MARSGAWFLAAVLCGCTAAPSAGPSGSSVPSIAPASALPTADPTASPVPIPTLAPTAPILDEPFGILPGARPADYNLRITCNGEVGATDPVAIVRLVSQEEADGGIVLRDFAAAEPRTVCDLGGQYPDQLIDARHVVIDGEDAHSHAIVELPSATYRWFELPDEQDPDGPDVYVAFAAVSPALDALTWLEWRSNPGTEAVHLTMASSDTVLASYPLPDFGRCGSPLDSRIGGFTSTGSHGFVLRQPTAELNSLVVFEGTTTELSIAPPADGWSGDRFPAMALWAPAGDTLYYTKGGNVWRWQPGAEPTRFLSGVSWFDPTISPDGRYLAYSAVTDGHSGVYLVDLVAGGAPVRIGDGHRTEPAFLTSNLLFFKTDGGGGCAGPAPRSRVYDMTTREESSTDIESVIATWPAASSR